MSYLNLSGIELEAANVSVPVKMTQRPRLIWAELDVPGFIGRSGVALAVFSSLAWMFIAC